MLRLGVSTQGVKNFENPDKYPGNAEEKVGERRQEVKPQSTVLEKVSTFCGEQQRFRLSGGLDVDEITTVWGFATDSWHLQQLRRRRIGAIWQQLLLHYKQSIN